MIIVSYVPSHAYVYSMRTGTVEQMGPPALQVYRVNGNLNLSRAIGDLTYKKDKTRQPHEQIICSTPDFMMEDRHADDEFVFLACDGVYSNFLFFWSDRLISKIL